MVETVVTSGNRNEISKNLSAAGCMLDMKSKHLPQQQTSICRRRESIKLRFQPCITRNINNMNKSYFAFCKGNRAKPVWHACLHNIRILSSNHREFCFRKFKMIHGRSSVWSWKFLSSADKLKDIPDLERVCIPETSVCLVIPRKEPKAWHQLYKWEFAFRIDIYYNMNPSFSCAFNIRLLIVGVT
jgi:hypothetical protein